MGFSGTAFTAYPDLQPAAAKQSFGDKVLGGLKTTAEAAGAAKTIYDVGKGIWGAVSRIAPLFI